MLERVISGGQTGADQAGWRAARACGIATGGWMPMGFRTEGRPDADGLLGADEAHPEFADLYEARAHESLEYRLRTRANVQEGDAVVWFGDPLSRSGRLTLGLAQIVGIPAQVIERAKTAVPPSPRTSSPIGSATRKSAPWSSPATASRSHRGSESGSNRT